MVYRINPLTILQKSSRSTGSDQSPASSFGILGSALEILPIGHTLFEALHCCSRYGFTLAFIADGLPQVQTLGTASQRYCSEFPHTPAMSFLETPALSCKHLSVVLQFCEVRFGEVFRTVLGTLS